MFSTPAFAQAAIGAEASNTIMSMAPLALIFVVFYFLLIRPQQKKMKQHKDLLSSIRRGDRVITGGGIFGTVNKVIGDNELSVEIAEGVRVRVVRSTVVEIVSKPEPAKGGKDSGKDEDESPAKAGGDAGAEEAKK